MEANKTSRYSSGRVGEKYFKLEKYLRPEKYADWWCVLWTSAGASYDCVLAKKVITQLYVLSELASTHQPSTALSWRAGSGQAGHPGVGSAVPPSLLIDRCCNLYNFLLLLSSLHLPVIIRHSQVILTSTPHITVTQPHGQKIKILRPNIGFMSN